MILLTRKAEFSSAHYYWNEAWTEAENRRVFGRCANRNGHGHNYTLEVTVAGEVDPVSGFVVDLKELKEILEREVVSVYDHRHLNLEVAGVCGGNRNGSDDGEHCDCDLASGWRGRFLMRNCTGFACMRRLTCLRTTTGNDDDDWCSLKKRGRAQGRRRIYRGGTG